MTIRRSVDIAAINKDFMLFEHGLTVTPPGFERTKGESIRDCVLGYSADEFLRVAALNGLATCNCDGIREIEALMFDMIRRQNPDCGIEEIIVNGLVDQEGYP